MSSINIQNTIWEHVFGMWAISQPASRSALITPTSGGHTFSGVRGIYHFPNRCPLSNLNWNPVKLWENTETILSPRPCVTAARPGPQFDTKMWTHSKITRLDPTIDNNIPAPSTKLTCLILLDFPLFVWSDFSFILSPLSVQRHLTSPKPGPQGNFLCLRNWESPDCVLVSN